jgi:hypothetical protein
MEVDDIGRGTACSLTDESIPTDRGGERCERARHDDEGAVRQRRSRMGNSSSREPMRSDLLPPHLCTGSDHS